MPFQTPEPNSLAGKAAQALAQAPQTQPWREIANQLLRAALEYLPAPNDLQENFLSIPTFLIISGTKADLDKGSAEGQRAELGGGCVQRFPQRGVDGCEYLFV
jgi:hypothetical protein